MDNKPWFATPNGLIWEDDVVKAYCPDPRDAMKLAYLYNLTIETNPLEDDLLEEETVTEI